MLEEPAAPDSRLDLIARIAGLQLIPGNVHHLESPTKLRAFATTLTGGVSVAIGTFAEFVQRFEQATGEGFADGGRFEFFVTAEVPFYSTSYLTLQGYDPTSGADVGHLLLAVFGAHDFDFPAEYLESLIETAIVAEAPPYNAERTGQTAARNAAETHCAAAACLPGTAQLSTWQVQ